MNDLDAVEVLSPDIRAAVVAVIDRYPGVTTVDQLVADVTLMILDEDLVDDFLDPELYPDRCWWLQGAALRIVRSSLTEQQQHREAR